MPSGLVRPSRFAIALALGLMLFAMGGMQKTQPAFALTNCSVNDSFDEAEQAFLQMINTYRAQHGVAPVTVSTNLNRSAAWMARDMATKNYFSHTDSSGRSVATRLEQCDVQPYTGENIAAGTYRDSAQDAFTAWRNSPGHNTNMLRSEYLQIGIARYYNAGSRYGWYWVTDFSTSDDGTSGSSGSWAPPPPAAPTASPTSTAPIASAPGPAPTSAPPSAPVDGAAEFSSPADGSTLGNSEVFRWNAVNDALGYRVTIGSTEGASNLLTASLGKQTTLRINGFPSNGATLYIRLWTRLPSGWIYNDYTYRLSD